MLELLFWSVPKKKSDIRIKKADTAAYAAIALTESGKLYCRGSVGRLRGVGSTETFTDRWALIDDDVNDYWLPGNLDGVIYRKNDGVWWGSGYVYGFGGALNKAIKSTMTSNFASLPADKVVLKVVVGPQNIMVLMDDGTVYNAGNGYNGALGIRNTTNNSVTILDKLLTGAGTGFPEGLTFKDIAVGRGTSVVYLLGNNNQLYGLGDGSGWALGSQTATTNSIAVPLFDGGGNLINALNAGINCCYMTMNDKYVLGFGSYYLGQLGGGNYTSDYSKGSGNVMTIALGSPGIKYYVTRNRLYVDNGGKWLFTGDASGYIGSSSPIKNGTPSDITAGMGVDLTGAVISSQHTFSTAAVKDGVLYGTGYNYGYANQLAPIRKDSGSNIFIPLDLTGIEV